MRPLRATYRLQLHGGFPIHRAREIVPYLSKLGISHAYASPMFAARPGSTHGYDVTDPTALNPQLGTDDERRQWINELHERGMGLLLDIVPNHMATGPQNWRWEDVLMYGRQSPYARWFDIDWASPVEGARGRVLVPVLGDRRSRVIEQDELSIALVDGRLRVRYYDHSFPVSPFLYANVLRFTRDRMAERGGASNDDVAALDAILADFERMGRGSLSGENARDRAEALLTRLAQLCEGPPAIRDRIERSAADFGRGPEGHRRIENLLSRQPYVLVYWRRAAREINYRRFFDINDLISLRTSDTAVVEEAHALVFRWIGADEIDALRIDHIDGLYDPRGYIDHLLARAAQVRPGAGRFPVYVEKILSGSEVLRTDWHVCGTTGYEALNMIDGLFVDARGFTTIESYYTRDVLRRSISFRDLARQSKRRVLQSALSSYVTRLVRGLREVIAAHPDRATFTLDALREAIIEVTACLPAYRTYVTQNTTVLDDADRHLVDTAVTDALAHAPRLTDEIHALGRVLRLEGIDTLDGEQRYQLWTFVQRFQQLTGPAAAKGIEDTAFYVYVPLASRNEVGAEPDESLEEAVNGLHRHADHRARHWPLAMVCTSTHDTKRSADVRSRLAVLAEIPDRWIAAVRRWREWNARFRRRVSTGFAPDANTEYLFYQSVVGIWPLASGTDDPAGLPPENVLTELADRLDAYMLKAAREAKVQTNWVDQKADFERSLTDFVRGVFQGDAERRFLQDLNDFVAQVARTGLWTALSRTVCHMALPGIPDIYQGDEIWNFSLVDPDNRRPADFDQRKRFLHALDEAWDASDASRDALVADLLTRPEDGRIKLHVIRRALAARQAWPALFTTADYRPLRAAGDRAGHVFAFARRDADRTAIIVVPRLIYGLVGGPDPPIGERWSDTILPLPVELPSGPLYSAFTGEQFVPTHGTNRPALALSDMLGRFPVALLTTGGVDTDHPV